MPPDQPRPGTLPGLEQAIVSCRACPRLVAWREAVVNGPRHRGEPGAYWARPLTGFGDPHARIVLVGLAPAAHGGNRTGRMFTGDRSGDFLFAALHRAGLANQPTSVSREDGLVLDDAFVTAAVRCAPPDNKPTPAERSRCAPYLLQELALLSRARVLVALGAFALESLSRDAGLRFETKGRPRFAHGLSIEATGAHGPLTVLCSYHPSQRNVFTGLLRPEMLDEVLRNARSIARDAGSAR